MRRETSGRFAWIWGAIALGVWLASPGAALAQEEDPLDGPVCCELAGSSDEETLCTVETVDACLAASGAPILSEMCCTLDEIVALGCTPAGTCDTGQEGKCSSGRYECRDGGLACVPTDPGCEASPAEPTATPAATPVP